VGDRQVKKLVHAPDSGWAREKGEDNPAARKEDGMGYLKWGWENVFSFEHLFLQREYYPTRKDLSRGFWNKFSIFSPQLRAIAGAENMVQCAAERAVLDEQQENCIKRE